jgi:hypothetical protein
MPLPATVRVKLSSEAAEVISITPVVVQDLSLRELIEHMLAVTGKDEARIREILLRGTLVSGASRLRWAGWEPEPGPLRDLLATFPDSDPLLPFAAARCTRAVLRGGRLAIDIPREVAARKGILRRGTFWDLLMEVAASVPPAYSAYSYRDRADCFVCEFPRPAADRIRAASGLVSYTTLREQIRTVSFVRADLYVAR